MKIIHKRYPKFKKYTLPLIPNESVGVHPMSDPFSDIAYIQLVDKIIDKAIDEHYTYYKCNFIKSGEAIEQLEFDL